MPVTGLFLFASIYSRVIYYNINRQMFKRQTFNPKSQLWMFAIKVDLKGSNNSSLSIYDYITAKCNDCRTSV